MNITTHTTLWLKRQQTRLVRTAMNRCNTFALSSTHCLFEQTKRQCRKCCKNFHCLILDPNGCQSNWCQIDFRWIHYSHRIVPLNWSLNMTELVTIVSLNSSFATHTKLIPRHATLWPKWCPVRPCEMLPSYPVWSHKQFQKIFFKRFVWRHRCNQFLLSIVSHWRAFSAWESCNVNFASLRRLHNIKWLPSQIFASFLKGIETNNTNA